MCPQYASKKAANCCSFPRCISVYFCAVNWNRHQRSCTLPEVSDRVAITMFLAEDPCFLGCVREMYHFIVAFFGQLQRESSTLIKHARQNQTNTNSKSPSRSIGFFAKISRHEYMNTYIYIFQWYVLISRNSRNRSIEFIFGYFIPLEALSLADFTVVAGVPSVVRLRIEEAFAISGLCRYRLACLHDFQIFI